MQGSCCFVLWSVWVYFGIVWVSRGVNLGHVGVSLESVCSLSASVGCLFSIYGCSRSQSPGEAFVWMDDTEDIQHPCIPPHLVARRNVTEPYFIDELLDDKCPDDDDCYGFHDEVLQLDLFRYTGDWQWALHVFEAGPSGDPRLYDRLLLLLIGCQRWVEACKYLCRYEKVPSKLKRQHTVFTLLHAIAKVDLQAVVRATSFVPGHSKFRKSDGFQDLLGKLKVLKQQPAMFSPTISASVEIDSDISQSGYAEMLRHKANAKRKAPRRR